MASRFQQRTAYYHGDRWFIREHTTDRDLYVVSCNDFNRYWYNIKTNEVTPIDHHMDIPQEIIDEIKDMVMERITDEIITKILVEEIINE